MSISVATRFRIPLRAADIEYLVGNSSYTYDEVKELITKMLNDVLETTLLNIEEWIDYKVPKRTGQLRDNLKKHIRSSRVSGNIMRIIMGTSIEYAQKVNEMTTGQVRHVNTNKENSGAYAYAYYYGNYGRIHLNDPRAIGHFWDELIEFTKERIMINLTKEKYKLVSDSKFTTRNLTRVVVE